MKSPLAYLIVNRVFLYFFSTALLFFFSVLYADDAVMAKISNDANSSLTVYVLLVLLLFGVCLLGVYLYKKIVAMAKQRAGVFPTEFAMGIDDTNVMRVNSDLKVEYMHQNKKDEVLSFQQVLLQRVMRKHDRAAIMTMVGKQFKLAEFGLNYGEVRSKNNNQTHIYHVASKPVLNKNKQVIYVDVLWKDHLQQKKRMATLVGQAERDHLTGLVNRMCFDRFIDAFPENAKPNAKNVLCFMDLDNFKPVNDSGGHAAGDELLKQLAEIFQQHVRSSDLLARIGGDEFAILFPDCSMQQAQQRFERIINHVSSLRFSWEGKSFVIGVSMGAVEFSSAVSARDMQELCKTADDACYIAKEKGRNQLYIHRANGVLKKSEHTGQENWSEILRNALDHDAFKLYVQPIIPLSPDDNDHKKRFEIYIRLAYNGRILRPGSFFPAAERAGLSRAIDRWVVRRVFARLARLNAESADGVLHEFTINLSAGSLLDNSFAGFIHEQLNKYHLSAGSMCFEVSESAVVSNFTQARKFLVKLAALGCSNSLDDFGSGLSALNYIRDLPIHYLKIDGVFVRNIEKNQIDAAMIHSLNHMSKVMNLKTVAEFVEDEHTAMLLRRLGVNYAQGYYCGRPLPLERFEASKKTELVLIK